MRLPMRMMAKRFTNRSLSCKAVLQHYKLPIRFFFTYLFLPIWPHLARSPRMMMFSSRIGISLIGIMVSIEEYILAYHNTLNIPGFPFLEEASTSCLPFILQLFRSSPAYAGQRVNQYLYSFVFLPDSLAANRPEMSLRMVLLIQVEYGEHHVPKVTTMKVPMVQLKATQGPKSIHFRVYFNNYWDLRTCSNSPDNAKADAAGYPAEQTSPSTWHLA